MFTLKITTDDSVARPRSAQGLRIAGHSPDGPAAVDDQQLTGHVVRRAGGKVDHAADNALRLAEPAGRDPGWITGSVNAGSWNATSAVCHSQGTSSGIGCDWSSHDGSCSD